MLFSRIQSCFLIVEKFVPSLCQWYPSKVTFSLHLISTGVHRVDKWMIWSVAMTQLHWCLCGLVCAWKTKLAGITICTRCSFSSSSCSFFACLPNAVAASPAIAGSGDLIENWKQRQQFIKHWIMCMQFAYSTCSSMNNKTGLDWWLIAMSRCFRGMWRTTRVSSASRATSRARSAWSRSRRTPPKTACTTWPCCTTNYRYLRLELLN